MLRSTQNRIAGGIGDERGRHGHGDWPAELGGLRVLSAELVDRGGVPHVRLKVLNEQQRVRVIVRPLFDNDR